MNNNIFSNFVKGLTGNSNTAHLDLDVTWDIPNLLLNSNELLLIMLTKLSIIQNNIEIETESKIIFSIILNNKINNYHILRIFSFLH